MSLADASELDGPKLYPTSSKWRPKVTSDSKRDEKRTIFTTSRDPEKIRLSKEKHERKRKRVPMVHFCPYCRTWPEGPDSVWDWAKVMKHKEVCVERKKFKNKSEVAQTAKVIEPAKVSQKRRKLALVQVRKPRDPKCIVISM
jgi:hypothetical protein